MEALERQAWCRPAIFLVLLLLPAVYIPGSWPWISGTWGLAALGFGFRHLRVGTGARTTVLLALGAILALGWGLRSMPPLPGFWPFEASGEDSGRGTVVAEAPVSRRGGVPFRLRVDEVATGELAGHADATVTVLGWKGSSPATGSRWAWRGKVDPTAQTLVWESGQPSGWAAPWWQARADARRGAFSSLTPLGPAPAALAEALLLGAVDDLTPWEKDSFRQSGCSHVLALSGMHLSLLAALLMVALHRRTAPWVAFAVVQLVLGTFCFLAGPIPSLWRAWAMAFLGGLWSLIRRPVPLAELLAQSFVVSVFLWPEMAPSLSLELSFLAMAGLFLWAVPWERSLRPWAGRWVAASLGSSAAALAATVPLTLALFGEVRWIGLVATPALVFLTTVFLYGAALVVILGTLCPWFDPLWIAPGFQGVYDLIFACTAWASGFPALGSTAGWAVITLGGLGVAAFFLYNRRTRSLPLPVDLNYDSPASLQAFLDDKGYNALKRWGQNFLINAGARRQILAALDLKPGEPVWEVGPGLGALTHHLVAQGHPLTVFEIDPGYAQFLREEFGGAPGGFQLVEGDVVKTWKTQPLTGVKTVGNLPYNAASAIVADFIEGGFFPEVFVVTVQLEMAQRMTASPGTKNYSSFSVLCQSVFRLDDIVTLRPGSFYPAPEVTSRVVRLRPHGRFPGLDHGRFSVFVRECFSSRRKTLRNNLPGAASALKVSDESMRAAFEKGGIDLGLRAEVLTVDQFAGVFGALG